MSLKHSLLALLSRRSKTGYELSKDFEGSTGFFWTATHQQIYKELKELEERSWVRFAEVLQKDKPDKKIYTITRDGRSELKRWAEEESPQAPSKDAFLIKLFIGDLVDPAFLLQDLKKQRVLHQERQNRYREIERQYFHAQAEQPPRRKFQYLTLKRGMMFERFWLEWAEEAEKVLLEQSQTVSEEPITKKMKKKRERY